MFSFRTTPLQDQLDKALTEGKVGCFCTQNCWDPDSGRYMYEIFRSRGNLAEIFSPRDAELSPVTNHMEYDLGAVGRLDAIVVEIQDVGTRYFNYTRDLFRLMSDMKSIDEPPALYVADHVNPAGRVVEGTVPSVPAEDNTPRVAHRHGLTLGELAYLYHSEIGAKYPLHVISASVTGTGRQVMPWTIAPASDIPGLFTCDMYSGGGLWNNTSITPGIGTARPYEYIGAPFIRQDIGNGLPAEQNVMLRPCSFTPSSGQYSGTTCHGFQIILEPGAEYHSLMHTLQMMRYFRERYSAFELYPEFYSDLADDTLAGYVDGKIGWTEAREHIKVEEQKWIRKAKKFSLYGEQPFRIK